MTGYTVHTGSTEKFTEGWDRIFGGAKKKKSQKKPSTAQKRTAKTRKSQAKG